MRKLEENLQNLESKAKGKDQIYKNLQEKIQELEGQIELKRAMQNDSEKKISQLSAKLRGKEETCGTLQQKVGFGLTLPFELFCSSTHCFSNDMGMSSMVFWSWFLSSYIKKKFDINAYIDGPFG